ncbi:MAG: AmpG family muropeptide MFS transporter [Desulfobacteraceae bacterium]|nr:AmpG family muropeptide MFS transporter [Desulfobacteraceae bacterium]
MPRPSMLKMIFSRRMLTALMMGYASGLPYDMTKTVLKAWMTDVGVDLTVIGLFTLVGLPYALKFLWAPVLDRFTFSLLGRRRGWMLIFQLALMLAIIALGRTNPAANPWMVAIAAMLVTFFSASQDIVVDAYRREDLPDAELGLGSSFYFYGYRIGMLVAGPGGLILADQISFQMVYMILAACLLPGVITTLLSPEPPLVHGVPRNFKEAVVHPFVEYFQRPEAMWMLAFILLFKIGDNIASAITTPFYLNIGFTKTQIGAVITLFGFWAVSAGGLVGGLLMLKLGIHRSLWVFGILQAISTAGFSILALMGHHVPALAAVISFENFTSGMGTAAFMAFMASITHQKFTATQYALLTSLMRIPDVGISSLSGWLAGQLGWVAFFIFCSLAAIPGLLMLLKFASWRPGQRSTV